MRSTNLIAVTVAVILGATIAASAGPHRLGRHAVYPDGFELPQQPEYPQLPESYPEMPEFPEQ